MTHHINQVVFAVDSIVEINQFDVFNLLFVLLLSSLVDAWSVAFSPDSKYIATGSHLGKVNIFGVESGKKEYSLDTRGKFILSIAYVRNRKLSFWSAGWRLLKLRVSDSCDLNASALQ